VNRSRTIIVSLFLFSISSIAQDNPFLCGGNEPFSDGLKAWVSKKIVGMSSSTVIRDLIDNASTSGCEGVECLLPENFVETINPEVDGTGTDYSKFTIFKREDYDPGDVIAPDHLTKKFPVIREGSNYSLKLGDGTYRADAYKITGTFKVPDDNPYLTYYSAIVLEEPAGHDPWEMPFYDFRVFDSKGEEIECARTVFTAGVNTDIEGFEDLSNTKIDYRPWTANVVNLEKHKGTEVTIQVVTSECHLGGHRGYGYIDFDCSAVSIEIAGGGKICVGQELTFTSQATGLFKDELYKWEIKDKEKGSSEKKTFSTEKEASTTINSTGKKDITLTITNKSDNSVCKDRIIKMTDVQFDCCPINEGEIEIEEDCLDNESTFEITGYNFKDTYYVEWDFGDDKTSPSKNPSKKYNSAGVYKVTATISNEVCTLNSLSKELIVRECCKECITSFSPDPGKEYVLSAWVKEEYTDLYPDTYKNSGVQITFNKGTIKDLPIFKPSGPIIDGWQRIEQSFVIPLNAVNIQINLENLSDKNNAYFDDVRVHTFSGNMKSYVYDPSTQKLTAELDENNYATKYEYDDEGILIRVKKETTRGVMTIKESRNNQSKINK
jgi:PKD repeat protein